MASEAHYLACRHSPHVTCPRAGAGGRQAGALTEPSHTPGQEAAGRPDTDGTCALKVRSENFPDFHSVTSWGHVDGQPAPRRREGAGRAGRGWHGVSAGQGWDWVQRRHIRPPEPRVIYLANWRWGAGGGL